MGYVESDWVRGGRVWGEGSEQKAMDNGERRKATVATGQ